MEVRTPQTGQGGLGVWGEWAAQAHLCPYLTCGDHRGRWCGPGWPNPEDPRLAPGALARRPAAAQDLPRQSVHPTAAGPLRPSVVSFPEPLPSVPLLFGGGCLRPLRGWEAPGTMAGGEGSFKEAVEQLGESGICSAKHDGLVSRPSLR